MYDLHSIFVSDYEVVTDEFYFLNLIFNTLSRVCYWRRFLLIVNFAGQQMMG